MEVINEGSKLVAQALQKLAMYDNLCPNQPEIEESIKLLEDALIKLTNML